MKKPSSNVVGVIGGLFNNKGQAYNIIYWGVSTLRTDRNKPSYKFPPLGPYAQQLYKEMFRKWGR